MSNVVINVSMGFEILKKLRDERRWTLQELANKMGSYPQQISKFELGHRKLTLEWIQRFADVFSVSPNDIVSLPDASKSLPNKKSIRGSGDYAMREDLSFGPDYIPIVGTASGANDTIILNFEQHIGRVLRHPNQANVKNAWSFRVAGESMSPRYNHGELAFVNGGFEPELNSDCLVELNDGGALLKTFVRKTDKDVVLAQLYPVREFKYPRKDIRAIHAVVGRG